VAGGVKRWASGLHAAALSDEHGLFGRGILAPMALTVRFSQALQFAHERHAAQVRKGSGVPYIAHLLGVASIALEHGADEDEAIGGLLHDVIEDQDVSPEELTARFGAAVSAIVVGCTDGVHPKPPWRERKERYLAHLPSASPSVKLVSCADKLYNARTILADYRVHGEALWGRFAGGRDGTLWYYRALADAFRRHFDSPLVEELGRTVDEIERLAATAAQS
jgi:GTP pyrophosphokinase